MKRYKLVVMSFDGDIQTERPDFETIEQAWNYSNNLGSKWYFYPFHFVTTASGKTVADAPQGFENLKGERMNYVRKCFKQAADKPENADADVESWEFKVCWV